MDAMQALEQFKSTGETKRAKKFTPTPSLKFDKKGGQYVIGKLKSKRDLNNSKAGKSVLQLELIDTNAQFTISTDGEGDTVSYTPIAVKAGDSVGVFAPTELHKYMANVAIGSEVYIRCDGKVKQVRDGKSIESYQFDVRHK